MSNQDDNSLRERAREAAERLREKIPLLLGLTDDECGLLTAAFLNFARPLVERVTELEAVAARFEHEAVLHLSGNPANTLPQMVEDPKGYALSWLNYQYKLEDRLTTAERELSEVSAWKVLATTAQNSRDEYQKCLTKLRKAVEKYGKSKGWAVDHVLYAAAREREGGGDG